MGALALPPTVSYHNPNTIWKKPGPFLPRSGLWGKSPRTEQADEASARCAMPKLACGYQKPRPPCRFIHLGHAEYTPAPTPIH